MKKSGLSEQVRSVAIRKFVEPAVKSGRVEFSIPVREMLDALIPLGFPANNTPQVCTSIQTQRFLEDCGLDIVRVDGPPKKLSTTVVVHYRVRNRGKGESMGRWTKTEASDIGFDEAPEARAKRLTEKLRGLLKDELTEYGGGEAFLKWIRSEDEEAA